MFDRLVEECDEIGRLKAGVKPRTDPLAHSERKVLIQEIGIARLPLLDALDVGTTFAVARGAVAATSQAAG